MNKTVEKLASRIQAWRQSGASRSPLAEALDYMEFFLNETTPPKASEQVQLDSKLNVSAQPDESCRDWSKIKISLDLSTGEQDANLRAFSNSEPHEVIDDGGGHITVCMTGYLNEPHLVHATKRESVDDNLRLLNEETIEHFLTCHPKYLHNPLTGNERGLIRDIVRVICPMTRLKPRGIFNEIEDNASRLHIRAFWQ